MVMLGQRNVMNKLKKEELETINGGSISGTLLNAFTSTIKTLYDFGRSLGNAVRRIKEDKLCEVH